MYCNFYQYNSSISNYKIPKGQWIRKTPYLTVGRHSPGKNIMESITKNVPGGSQHCLYTRLIKDFVCQHITDILKAILQQAEMLHPPFRYQCGCEQWPNPTTTTYKQELSKTPPANTSNKWKLKLVIRKWLHYKRGLKTFLP